MIYEIHHALLELAPGTKWVIRGDSNDIGNLEWNDLSIKKPSKIAIDAWLKEKNDSEPMRLLRIERDARLAKTDWQASSDRTMTREQIAYRKALRDITNTATPKLLANGKLDLTSVDWPVES